MRRSAWRRVGLLCAGIAGLGFALVLGAVVVARSGIYDVAATYPHPAPLYRLISIAMRQSVRIRAAQVVVPRLDAPQQFRTGLACYRRHCVQCHGAPGIAPEPAALGLMPLPASLLQAAREWPAAELYWVVRHGVRMTAMPAWEFRMSDEALWATVAFLQRLPRLTPTRYRELAADAADECPSGAEPARGDARERGRRLIRQYACITCHRVPGVVGPDVYVGPPLDGIGRRAMLAGALPNTPDNLVRWIVAPEAVSPGTAMPDLHVAESHARDIAQYLGSLR